MVCKKCGEEIKGNYKFCPNCGDGIVKDSEKIIQSNEGKQVSEIKENVQNDEKSKKNTKIIILITVLSVVIIALIIALIITLNVTHSQSSNVQNDASQSQEASQIQDTSQGQDTYLKDIYDKSLGAGTYVVGKDLEPGIYHFTYTPSPSSKHTDSKGNVEYWGDWIWVTHKNSSGKNETLGGTKYDERVKGNAPEQQVSIKFSDGDTVQVEGENGSFGPGKK